MENWIWVKFFVSQEREAEFPLNFIKPMIQDLRSKFNISSYHVLFESQQGIWLRILTDTKNIDIIKKRINQSSQREKIRVEFDEFLIEEYKKNWGDDGWVATYKFLEAGSDIAIGLLDQGFKKNRNNFNKLSIIHHFLNQTGLKPLQEIRFYLNSIGKMLNC
jgi:hypothetical protein